MPISLGYSAPAKQALPPQPNSRRATIVADQLNVIANTAMMHLAASAVAAPIYILYERNASSTMPAPTGYLSANKVIPALLSLLLAAVVFIFISLKGDVDELKKDSKEMLKQAQETRLELVKAINAVEKQAVGTNARLEQMLLDRQKR